VPFACVRALLSAAVGCPLSVGTVVSLVQRCAAAVEETEAQSKAALQTAPVWPTWPAKWLMEGTRAFCAHGSTMACSRWPRLRA
jgi:hypothetical protein